MPISCICCSTGTSPTSARNLQYINITWINHSSTKSKSVIGAPHTGIGTDLLSSTNSTVPIVMSRKTCPTITKFFDENARASIAVKHKARSKNVIFSTDHVGACTARQHLLSFLINLCNAKPRKERQDILIVYWTLYNSEHYTTVKRDTIRVELRWKTLNMEFVAVILHQKKCPYINTGWQCSHQDSFSSWYFFWGAPFHLCIQG